MNENSPLIIANFKANQTWEELESWIDKVNSAQFTGSIIIAPSAPFLSAASIKLRTLKSKIKLSSQDISRFQGGAYTGETTANQVASLVTHSIIGHSERRHNFSENDEILSAKVENAKKAKLTPIFCVENSEAQIPSGVEIVAYEPTFAIGTGTPDTPQNAKEMAQAIKSKGDCLVLYGGSVTVSNCKDYLIKDIIDGLLIGASSLDPNNFLAILNSSSY